jgi:TonB-dependent SusC/RagA subfamily outer membrane receptor
MKRIVMIVGGLIFLVSLSAQNRIIQGKVTVFNQFGVPHVEVTAKKAKKTVTTDAEGNFTLACNEKDNLLFKGKVFHSITKRLDWNEDQFSINLIFKDTPRNRALATSMGYISEKDLDYALKNLQEENNDYCSYQDVFTLIRNKFSDVDVGPTSEGEPGVFIRRGQKSMFGQTHALYVVDGARVSDISFVSPCRIASIRILKDGAAAIYGAGSSNGAVVIETKKAR